MKRLASVLLFLFAAPAFADPPVIENATARQASGAWRFDVTLSHPDTGWDHYADGWRVLDASGGTELGMRVLYHPHVEEQPFTRSLDGVTVPEGAGSVLIEARCNVDGWAGTYFRVELPGR